VTTKNHCKEKYLAQKELLGRKPNREEFLAFADVNKRALDRLYGASSYSKLQQECGDDANTFLKQGISLDEIMTQYGDLALSIDRIPVGADWTHAGCRPSTDGLQKGAHGIVWSKMSERFREWAKKTRIEKYQSIVEMIPVHVSNETSPRTSAVALGLSKLLVDIHRWSPARRRNTEGEYKIELRKWLESIGYSLNEEYGESTSDLVVGKRYVIETKKAPQLGDYDRLFGQLARHLQQHPYVIAVIFDVPSEDKLDNFSLLVDRHLNVEPNVVEIVKK
jgi:hypothetical protein